MSGGHDDFAVEPIPGLPEKLPQGEHILWQGSPNWRGVARDVFHLRFVAAYLVALVIWRASAHWGVEHSVAAAAGAAISLLPICAIVMGVLVYLAKLSARTSIYTITNRRIVLRVGMALPTAINLPFAVIAGAAMNPHRRGDGDIAISLDATTGRMAWSNLWPHVRPWRLTRPEPMLRDIPNVHEVAAILSGALAAAQPAGRVYPIERQIDETAVACPAPIGQAA